ncbi:head completion/stabilization protein [Serratia proteamaculans]|uniref:head completion/stabilization protein n=1 Tax=Serratia proteamaculans TaxID=28151 RepID=UPI0021829CF4|nr:head completion/stabilization protein [Serratia proteamaculans]CAI2439617.1 Phage head completion protein (GPL) [Serratia proteamaculans]
MFNGKTTDYQDTTLTNNGFWPDLNLADFQERRSIPSDIDADTLGAALVASVAEINLDLEKLAGQLQAKGYTQASAVPGVKIGDKTALIAQYEKAVFARAKADLLGEYSTQFSRAPSAGQENPETRSRLLAEAATVLRNMKGARRSSARLV